ncbi:sialin isoform X1 [Procambarus clarkii]|uniref:sialin isoform X1 n=1 Tax=Procambarus clarkii TaxID=6728 RepID=UPI0037429727
MAGCKCSVNSFLTFALGWMPARISMALLALLGMMNTVMVRVNLSVAIVAMVRRNVSSITQVHTHCISIDFSANATHLEELKTVEDEASGTEDMSPALLAESVMEGELDWDEVTQGFVLGAFFYGYCITQILGGRLSELYGTRLVFGVSILAGGISAVFTPTVSRIHYGLLIALRVTQGLFQGATIPSMFPLMVRWMPPTERSRFIAYVLFCNNLSITLTMPLCGVVISSLGWDAAFYVTGAMSLTWCLLWFTLVYESPSKHPRISPEELEYINSNMEDMECVAKPPVAVPWREMATSLPVWALLLCDAGNSFGFSVYFSYLPTYIQNILGFSIQENGLLSALPFLCRYLGAAVFATTGDLLMARAVLSVLTIRRIFSAIAMFGPALNLLLVAYSGCDWSLAMTLLCLGFFLNGSITTGLFANRVDVTTNFCGTLSGLCNTCANVVSVIVPIFVGALTQNQQTLGQWQKVFWTCVPVYALTEIFFLIFASATIQKWNYSTEHRDSHEAGDSTDKDEISALDSKAVYTSRGSSPVQGESTGH